LGIHWEFGGRVEERAEVVFEVEIVGVEAVEVGTVGVAGVVGAGATFFLFAFTAEHGGGWNVIVVPGIDGVAGAFAGLEWFVKIN